MAKSRGKKFEEHFRENLNQVSDISIERLKDPQDGYRGNGNVCDFIVYKYPIQLCLELKSVQGKYFSFNNLTENQYRGLLEKSKVKGVVAGVVIWFVDYDKTIFVPIHEIWKAKNELKTNSINLNNLNKFNYTDIQGKKKRVFFDYDLKPFMENLQQYVR